MKNRIINLIICIYILSSSVSYSQYVIKGKVIGSNNLPMKRADIVWVSNLDRFPRRVIQKFSVKQDGSFEFDTHRKGLHRIWFCGVGHKSYLIPFYIEKPGTTVVTVQLQSLSLEGVKRVTIMAAYNQQTKKYSFIDTLNLNGESKIKKVYKGYGPQFHYEAKETGTSNYFGGTKWDNIIFECDSSFENKYNYYYINEINTVKDSSFLFEFDPSVFMQTPVKENYTFTKADEKTVKLLKMNEVYEKAWNGYVDYAQDGYKKGRDHDYVNAYSFDKDMKDLDDRIKKEKDPFMKNCWIIARMDIAGIDAFGKKEMKLSKELGQLALNSMEPDSPLWSYFSSSLPLAIAKASGTEKNLNDAAKNEFKISGINNPYLDYSLTALAKHPDPTIRTRLYGIVIANASKYGRSDLVVYYINKLKEEFPSEMDNRTIINDYSPKRSIKEENKIPKFVFASIHDSTKIITEKEMLGKKYLIHIWADWCGPCRTEVEAIRNLNNKFGGKNFEVLSVSICFTKENLFNFQKDHPMPWFNTHVDMRNDKAGFMKDFEVSAIPKDILVDEKGTIIAVNSLDKILELLSRK